MGVESLSVFERERIKSSKSAGTSSLAMQRGEDRSMASSAAVGRTSEQNGKAEKSKKLPLETN
jgi:hypothetical protein